MTFANLVTGDAVFVDANTFVHLFEPHPLLGPFCQQLIQRIDNQDLSVSPPVMSLAKFPIAS